MTNQKELVIQSFCEDTREWDTECTYEFSERERAEKDLREYALAYRGMNRPVRLIIRMIKEEN